MGHVQDLLNIARTTLSSKILTHDKDHFAELAVDAVLRLKGSTNLEAIQIIKKPGGTLRVGLSNSVQYQVYLFHVHDRVFSGLHICGNGCP